MIATGTIDMLNQVDAGKVDFAIVHGGSDMDHYHNIRQVGAIVGGRHPSAGQEGAITPPFWMICKTCAASRSTWAWASTR